jgi:allophanate hydrolase subunit 2
MPTKFELRLIVPAKLVGTIVELVEGEGILVEMKPHHENNKRKHSVPRHVEPGLTANDYMDTFLGQTKGKFTIKDVEQAFAKKGWARGTASSRLSFALQKKQIKRVGPSRSGLYERA